MQKEEYLIKNACYSVTKYYLCKRNNKRSLLGRKQRSQVARSFPNRYLFNCIVKVTSLFSISCISDIILHGKKGVFVFRYNGRRFCRCRKTVLLCRGCGLRHCNFYAIVLVYQIAKSGTNVVASHIFYNVTEVCIYVYSIV